MTEPVVHLRHCRQITRRGGRPMCAGGVRALCARYGVDFQKLSTTGVPGEIFRDSGDHYALKALANARAEQDGHGQR